MYVQFGLLYLILTRPKLTVTHIHGELGFFILRIDYIFPLTAPCSTLSATSLYSLSLSSHCGRDRGSTYLWGIGESRDNLKGLSYEIDFENVE